MKTSNVATLVKNNDHEKTSNVANTRSHICGSNFLKSGAKMSKNYLWWKMFFG